MPTSLTTAEARAARHTAYNWLAARFCGALLLVSLALAKLLKKP